MRLLVRLLGREAAREVVDALAATGSGPVDVADALGALRSACRGLDGRAARAVVPTGPVPGGPDSAGADRRIAAVDELLPGVDVRRHGFGRRVLALRATAADGLRMKVKAPDREDLVPELVAGAVEVALAIRRRFGRMASGVHTIVIDDGAGSYDDHSTAGSAQSGSGTFFLDTSLAFADAIATQRRRMAGGGGVSAAVPPPFTSIDGVVAHEYWHNLDTTVLATPALYVEINGALGDELGVETFEHALRGGEAGAPAAWQAARARVGGGGVALRAHQPPRGDGRDVQAVVVLDPRGTAVTARRVLRCPARPPLPAGLRTRRSGSGQGRFRYVTPKRVRRIVSVALTDER